MHHLLNNKWHHAPIDNNHPMPDDSSLQYLQGAQEGSIDGKGRLPVPSMFRKAFAASKAKEIVVCTDIFGGHFLLLCSPARWEKFAQEVSSLHENAISHQQHQKARILKRMFFSGSAPARAFDSSGRVLLSPQHRGLLGEDKVKLVGAGDRVEVWAMSNWQETFKQHQDQDADYYEGLDMHGLS